MRRHRAERSELTIQRRVLDCCAALAMTVMLLFAAPATGQNFPARPAGPVLDGAQLLSPATESALDTISRRILAETSDAVVVVTVPTLEGRPIRAYAKELGNRWGVGNELLDNGVMFLVAPKERSIWIGVGYGLEGLLTEARLRPIIAKMTSHFRSGAFDRGVLTGMVGVQRLLLSDRRRPLRKPPGSRS